ncbi:MAG: hypothetical protein QM645_13450 [Asticcacaulis sp.]
MRTVRVLTGVMLLFGSGIGLGACETTPSGAQPVVSPDYCHAMGMVYGPDVYGRGTCLTSAQFKCAQTGGRDPIHNKENRCQEIMPENWESARPRPLPEGATKLPAPPKP